MTTTRSKGLLAAIALFSFAGFFALIRLFPSLMQATDTIVVVRMVAQIGASVALLVILARGPLANAAAMGVRRPGLSTLGWGLAAFLLSAAVSAAFVYGSVYLGLGQNNKTLAALASRPVPIILLIALAAAISEEIIFRSILISHLEAATGRTWIAAALSLAAFAGMHASGWGAGQVLFVAVPGLVLTLFFLWKRNLLICIIAHFLTDALGLLGAAASMAHHG